MLISLRPDRQGRHHHRLVARHRQGHRRALAEHGAKVTVSSRKADACQEVADEINARHGAGRAIVVPANISSKEDLQRLVDETTPRSAGSTSWSATPPPTPITARWRDHRRAVPQDPGQQHHRQSLADLDGRAGDDRAQGRVDHHRLSIGGLRGTPVIGAYNISKAADLQLARNLAPEFGPRNIRVNCIAPGLVKTDFAKALWENPETRSR